MGPRVRYFCFRMTRRLATALCLLIFSSCQQSTVKVLIGATVYVAPGAQPIQDAVVVIAGQKIRSVGERKDIPIPQDSERVDLSGKYIIPALGARLAVESAADLVVTRSAPDWNHPQPPERRMVRGQWQ